MRKLDREFVARKVDYVLNHAGGNAPPIDLVSIAQFQRVRSVELCPMVIEGYMEPVQGGFQIFIKHRLSQSLNLNEPDVGYLKPRQRFTFAHEIAHTFFYELANDPPTLSKLAPKPEVIERLCDTGASKILLPDRLLIKYLCGKEHLNSSLILSLARRFGTSAEVVIRRINELDRVKITDQALILASTAQAQQDAQILAYCFHQSLLPYLSKPKPFSSLSEWSDIFKNIDEFWDQPMWDYRVPRGAGNLIIKKRPYSRRVDSFFIEIEFKK